MKTKYVGAKEFLRKSPKDLKALIFDIMKSLGCLETISKEVAEHLVNSSLSGVDSHGIWRILQYAEYYKNGYLKKNILPEIRKGKKNSSIIDGMGGIGIPAMNVAIQHSIKETKKFGINVVGVVNVGHTGRLGAYSEIAAKQNNLCIIIGGGGSKRWPLTVPFGGKEKRLSTNPYSIGIPGGKDGTVVIDFATSAIAGGWVYSAKRLGLKLKKGSIIDRDGNPTDNPDDYFSGGAILPAGGAKGYSLSVIAELIAEAMLGPVTLECNWLIITVDTNIFQHQDKLKVIAEEILSDIRSCPPAKGFEKVEIPGERERKTSKKLSVEGIKVTTKLWSQILSLQKSLNTEV